MLASHQAAQIDERDAQPGKILHELRVDKMANLNEIPQRPYFGNVDRTPLFLVLLGSHAAWSGSLDLFHDLRENVFAALEWIDRFGDSDRDGFVDLTTFVTSPRAANARGRLARTRRFTDQSRGGRARLPWPPGTPRRPARAPT